MFKWTCFGFAVLVTAALGWVVNDLRLQVKRTTTLLNESLPQVLANTKKSTETLAKLSDDIKGLRDLAGVRGRSDESLVAYADSVLDLIEASGGQIGVEAVIGKEMKDVLPAVEWVANARKEALLAAVPLSKSKAEVLHRLTTTAFLRSPWLIQFEGADPVPLADWLRANHAETKELPVEEE